MPTIVLGRGRKEKVGRVFSNLNIFQERILAGRGTFRG